MGVLKRKEERSETIILRVPASVKHDLSELRGRAEAAGFDLSATIAEALSRLLKQAREELGAVKSVSVRSSMLQMGGRQVEGEKQVEGSARS